MATKLKTKISKKSRKPNPSEVDYIAEVLGTLQEDIETIRNYNKDNPWPDEEFDKRDEAYTLWAKTCKTKKELIETYALLSGVVEFYLQYLEDTQAPDLMKGYSETAVGTQDIFESFQDGVEDD